MQVFAANVCNMSTLKLIAGEVGVSISTVSRALSGYPHVNEDVRQRIRAAASRWNYQPNAVARALRRSESRIVGIVVPDVENEFYATVAAVVQGEFDRQGYGLALRLSRDDSATERLALEELLRHRVDAILHVPATPNSGRWLRARCGSTPVIEINRRSSDDQFEAVVADDREGAAHVAAHLLALGHRRVAILAGVAHHSTSRERVQGFCDAYASAGYALQPEAIVHGEYSRDAGYEGTHRLLRTEPTAVFVAGGRLVLGALVALHELGYVIPRDLSVVGFGNHEWYEVCQPPLTTFALPLREMGLIAAQLVLTRLRSSGEHGTRRNAPGPVTRVSGHLIERESTRRA